MTSSLTLSPAPSRATSTDNARVGPARSPTDPDWAGTGEASLAPPRQRPSRCRPRAQVFVVLFLVLAVLTPSVASAHAVVSPKTSVPGRFEMYTLRVPCEKDVATTRVEIHFPAGMRVVSFEDVPGWQLQIITDSTKAVTGAVWTGTLLPKHFVEFPFEAGNPKTATRVAWPVYQTYANGERVEWTGPEHTKTPAPVTSIEPVGIGTTDWLAGGALLLALTSLGLTMRRPALAVGASPTC